MDYETDDVKRKKNPKEDANFFKRIFFLYTIPILKKGRKSELKVDDVYDVVTNYKSQTLGDQLEQQWSLLKENCVIKDLYKLLWRCYGKSYLLLGLLQLSFRTPFVLLQPLLLEKLLKYFKDPTRVPRNVAIYSSVFLILLNIINCIYNHNYMQLVTEFGLRVKIAFCSLLYRKVLKLTPSALSQITTGKVVTLITRDVMVFDRVFIFLNDMWIGSIHTAIICYMMFKRVEWSVFSGLTVLILLMPLQVYLGNKLTKLKINIGKKTDYRIQTTQEALSAIKLIKMYTWETFFQKKISKARRNEMEQMKRIYYIKSLGLIIPALNAKISFYLLIMTYVWLQNSLDAATAFFIISCYGGLRSYILNIIPFSIMSLSELHATLKRFKDVLKADEITDLNTTSTKSTQPLVYMNKIAVKMDGKEILSYVSLKLTSGLNIISGNLGSGKSSILKTILKEYPISKGILNIQGTVSFAPEEPWLFPSTIRQNILFGSDFNEKRYQEVLRVCALNKEMNKFPNGDQSIVGDKGINLSNGQKARISLARACYNDSNIYLLDDCLKALDSSVGKYVFQECIKGFLKDKIVIFVTNNVHYIKEADHNVILEKGKTATIERQREILDKRITYYMDDENMDHFAYESDLSYAESEESPLLENDANKSEKLYKESSKDGKVLLNVYKKYCRYYGGASTVIFVMIWFILFQIGTSYSDKLVTKWVNLEADLTKINVTNTTNFIEKKNEYNSVITVYSILVFVTSVLAIIKSVLHFFFSSRSSEKLHDSMLESVLLSKMKFFDENKMGTILNRFSKDLSGIDDYVPFLFYEVFRVMCSLTGTLIIIASVNYTFLVPSTFLLVKLYFIRRSYMPTGRSLKRLDAVTRSPLIGHINASIEGLTTIRAFKKEYLIKNEFDNHMNLFTSAFYMGLCTLRLLAFLLDLTCVFFIASIIVHFLIMSGDRAGNVGLAITQAMGLAGLLQWGIRQSAELETQMTSVERVLEYTENQKENKRGEHPGNWPSKGRIEYRNVNLRYNAKDEKALNNVSFIITPGTKVGIVGRTGAGKSSLISVLFRLYEIEGEILIDDINTRLVDLDTLRSKITVIPQDPILFNGTIRSNIDPVGKYRDVDIWHAIERINIKELVQSLDVAVQDLGQNFSSGQKQLICLARALVNESKIIVLDEATANMTSELDDQIQTTIKSCFQDCTILTIAHRIHSVKNSDMVMVVDDGKIVEFDTPDKLLEDHDSVFYRLANNANEID